MLNVKNLEFKYRGAKGNTLKGIDFNIHHGEIFGFLGPSGSGKTTLQKVLIGLLKGYNGRLPFLGRNVKTSDVIFTKRSASPLISPIFT